MKNVTFVFAAIVLGAMGAGAQAQAVYKCDWRSYSEQPCSQRIVRTYDAPVESTGRKPHDVVAHRLPGETSPQLAVRKRRIGLNASDRDECARLDKKMPFEQERIRNSPHQDEIDEAQDSLGEARKRFNQLRC